MGDALRRYADDAREMRLRQAPLFEDFAQELTGVNGWQAAPDHENLRSMVIDDFDIESVALRKAKAHSPLLVDADAPLTFAIALERLLSRRPSRRGRGEGVLPAFDAVPVAPAAAAVRAYFHVRLSFRFAAAQSRR